MKPVAAPIGFFVFGDPINGSLNPDSGDKEWFSMVKYPVADAKPLMAAINEVHEEALKTKPGWPKKISDVHIPMKPDRIKQEDGSYEENPDNVVISYKRKGTFKNKLGEKKENTAPRLFASNSHALTPEQTPPQIGRNSRVKMFFEPFAWQTKGNNKCGIQFKLWGVQIVELEEDTVEITPVEGGWVPTVEVETTMEGTLSPSEDDISAMLASA